MFATRLRWLALASVPGLIMLVGLLLNTISPWRQNGPLSIVRIGPDYQNVAAFDARALACQVQESNPEVSDTFRLLATCTVTINGEPLVININQRSVKGTCTATYQAQDLPCESAIPFYNASVPAVFIRSDLGLEPGTLRTIPGTNPLFYVSEGTWFWVWTVGAVLIASIATILFGRAAPATQRLRGIEAVVAHAALGFGLFMITWYGLGFAFLRSGLVD